MKVAIILQSLIVSEQQQVLVLIPFLSNLIFLQIPMKILMNILMKIHMKVAIILGELQQVHDLILFPRNLIFLHDLILVLTELQESLMSHVLTLTIIQSHSLISISKTEPSIF